MFKFIALLVLLFAGSDPTSEVRQWTSASGKFKVDAVLVETVDSSVSLRKVGWDNCYGSNGKAFHRRSTICSSCESCAINERRARNIDITNAGSKNAVQSEISRE